MIDENRLKWAMGKFGVTGATLDRTKRVKLHVCCHAPNNSTTFFTIKKAVSNTKKPKAGESKYFAIWFLGNDFLSRIWTIELPLEEAELTDALFQHISKLVATISELKGSCGRCIYL